MVPELTGALRSQGGAEIIVVVGGIVPSRDAELLSAAGVAAVYGPGTNIPLAAAEILGLIRERRKAA